MSAARYWPMPNRACNLTRQHKGALGKLDDEFRTAHQIGVREDILDTLVAHALAHRVLDWGEMRYQITQDGRDRQAGQPRPQGRA